MSVGNLALLVGILFCIFFLHLLVISGLEAYWLLEVIALVETLALSCFCSLSINDVAGVIQVDGFDKGCVLCKKIHSSTAKPLCEE